MSIGIAATATYLPENWMSAAEVAEASSIPEQVILQKFGLRGKHIAAPDEHVSDMSVEAASRLLGQQDIDPAEIDVVLYYGSLWKDFPVWQAAPWIAHRLGCVNAYALEYANVSCGTPVALRLARNFLLAEPELRNVLLVAACRESYLLDYTNERSRFMFNFGDGAVAGLLTRDAPHELLGCHALTDGSFSLQVKVPAGGSVEPASAESVAGRRHFLDVADPAQMKGGLDEVSLPNFVSAARGAVERSGARLEDISYLCGIHMKRSMHEAIVEGLGGPRAAYLDDTGHMSGVDSLLALDRAARGGELTKAISSCCSQQAPATPGRRRWSGGSRGSDRAGARLARGARSSSRGSTSSRTRPTTRSGSTPTPSRPRQARSGRRSRTAS